MRNGFGTTALVLGIIGVVFAVVPVVGVIAWPLVILGLIFGVLGILRASKGEANNKSMAITGTALSGVGLLLCLLWTVVFGAVVSEFDTPAYQLDGPAQQHYGAGQLPPQADVPHEPVEQVPDGTIPGDGTFVVGSEVQPGTYKTEGTQDFACYYARLADTSGEPQSIIANKAPQGPSTVTIEDTDGAFETSGCLPWTKVS